MSYDERLRNALAEQHRRCFDPDKRALRPEAAQYIDCPVCESSDKSLFLTKDWFTFSKCNQCSMVYLNPRLTEQATYDFYNSDWNAIYNEAKFDTVSVHTELDDRINQANLQRILKARNGRRGELLEIGFASGFFLRAAKEAGFSVHGLELNEPNYQRVRRDLGPTIHNEDLFRASLPDGFFDVVYMRDVFEHVPEPKPMLREINRIMKPGGFIYIEVPNIEGLIYKIVKERHVCIFGFEHLNYWSPATLHRILEATAFDVRATSFASLDFTVGDLVRSYIQPTHTTLYPEKISRVPELALKALNFVISTFPFRLPDKMFTPQIADRLQRGSVVQVLAEKAAIVTEPEKAEEFDIVIEAGKSARNYWRDVWRYRELLYFLSWRDLLVRYKQTVVGVAWALTQPLFTMIVFTIVFGHLAHLPSGNVPYPVLVFAAILPWQFFANSLTEITSSLIGNSNLLSKVYFPRIIIPASTLLVCFVDFLISAVILVVLMIWYRAVPDWHIVALPAFILLAFMSVFGIGLWLAILNVKYRDFRYVVPFIIQLGLFVSPVGFSSSVVADEWRLVYSLNPMVQVIEGFRWSLLRGQGELSWTGFGASLGLLTVMLAGGIWYFRKTEKTFADVL